MDKIISVLLIDSEGKLMPKLEKYFQNNKIKIIEFNTWEKMTNMLPDIIVVDTDLELNITLLSLKKTQFTYIPKIFITIRGLQEDRIIGYKTGCSVYLPKPFDPAELKTIIVNLVAQTKNTTYWILKSYVKIKKLKLKQYINRQNQTVLLTKQEKKILKEILDDKTNEEIAISLKVTKRNIERYVARLIEKTRSKNKCELKQINYNYLGE